MATEWFYTTNKQQMGPVTWAELRELAEVGILKPHDLIWTDGMEEWVKGITQPGLFAEGAESASSGKKSSYAAPKPPPGRRTRRREEEDDDEEDEKEAKKKSRKKQEERAKMAVGVKVGLILGAVVVALLFLACTGVGLVLLTTGGVGGAAPIAPYAINNLQERQHFDKQFNFKQNQRVVITVTNNRANMNVVLMVFRGNDLNNPLQRVPQVNQTCRAEFVLPSTDFYTVRVANFGPGVANNLNVTIDTR